MKGRHILHGVATADGANGRTASAPAAAGGAAAGGAAAGGAAAAQAQTAAGSSVDDLGQFSDDEGGGGWLADEDDGGGVGVGMGGVGMGVGSGAGAGAASLEGEEEEWEEAAPSTGVGSGFTLSDVMAAAAVKDGGQRLASGSCPLSLSPLPPLAPGGGEASDRAARDAE